ncbi:MAG: 50S ribosomal protein L11 methyltransferase [Clostridia bacterium]
MEYKQITINTTTDASELVADILSDLGSKGVSIFDSNDLATFLRSDEVWDYIDESLLTKSAIVKVNGFFTAEEAPSIVKDLEKRLQFLRENCPFDFGSLERTITSVDDKDWVSVWKQNYKPIKSGKITIVPNWINYSAVDGEIVVRLDPGMAFGTGEHESTRLCLSMLQTQDFGGKRIADIGTGSGILAIAMAKLGAESVEAFDIDDIAVDAAKENVALNGLSEIVKVANANLLDKANGIFDFVAANITADILMALSGQLLTYLKRGGEIVMSGIILARKQEVRAKFEATGFELIEEKIDGEWCGYLMRKI